jgi:hypothetical protein
MRRSPGASASRAHRSRGGASGSSRRAWTAWRSGRGAAVRDLFPPLQIAEVKALACELPAEKGVPLSRWSGAELAREAVARGIVERVSGVTVWRWLSADAIRPWNYRSWVFPRDPQFRQKAGPILDLYEGRWEGQLLQPGDFVVCADEKPSIQARARTHSSRPAKPGGGELVEHEYERKGALYWRSVGATSRSPNRSSGNSPAATWTACSTASTRTSQNASISAQPRDPSIRQDTKRQRTFPPATRHLPPPTASVAYLRKRPLRAGRGFGTLRRYVRRFVPNPP